MPNDSLPVSNAVASIASSTPGTTLQPAASCAIRCSSTSIARTVRPSMAAAAASDSPTYPWPTTPTTASCRAIRRCSC
jgi:hypothetical protein